MNSWSATSRVLAVSQDRVRGRHIPCCSEHNETPVDREGGCGPNSGDE